MCISFFETWDPSQRHTQSSQSTLIETQSIYAIKIYIERKSLKQSYCNGRLLFPSNFMKSSLLSLSLSSTCINRDDEPDHILMMNSDLMLIPGPQTIVIIYSYTHCTIRFFFQRGGSIRSSLSIARGFFNNCILTWTSLN